MRHAATRRLTNQELDRIQDKLGCVLPDASRRMIALAIEWAPFFRDMQAAFEETIFDIADEVVVHATGLERALRKAGANCHISHWLQELGGIYKGLELLGIRRESGIFAHSDPGANFR
jgi:hypothetical protein